MSDREKAGLALFIVCTAILANRITTGWFNILIFILWNLGMFLFFLKGE